MHVNLHNGQVTSLPSCPKLHSLVSNFDPFAFPLWLIWPIVSQLSFTLGNNFLSLSLSGQLFENYTQPELPLRLIQQPVTALTSSVTVDCCLLPCHFKD